MKKLAAALVMVLVLATGCVTTPKILWTKPGATQQDYAKDVYDCTRESETQWAGGGTGAMGGAMIGIARYEAQKRANTLFKMCMEARGWYGEVQKDNE